MVASSAARRRLGPGLDIVRHLLRLPADRRQQAIASLGPDEADALHRAWRYWAHTGQLAPAGDWSTWVLLAGRGFGKTLAGAQWLTAAAAEGAADLRIALVGASLDDARRVMIEGRSGLLTVAAPWIDTWEPSRRRLRFTTGAEAVIFSGCSPDMLRGPEFHLAWCDELAKWEKAGDCWDMLQFALRLGDHPRALVTTTPRPGPVLRTIMAAPGTAVTHGRTDANPHLSPGSQARIAARYAGTRLGRQELDGELLPQAGALWTVELIEACRMGLPSRTREGPGVGAPPVTEYPVESEGPPHRSGRNAPRAFLKHAGGMFHPIDPSRTREGAFSRTLVAVDPPAGDGTCGIVAVARDADGIVHVLADHSVTGRSPEGWARAVAAACAAHGTDEVVAEINQGGRMVAQVLHHADARLRVRSVRATVGKAQRAEPIAMLFEAGRVRLCGRMPELEAQLLGMIAGGGYEGPGASPDRADAMVWGVGEIMRGRGARVWGG